MIRVVIYYMIREIYSVRKLFICIVIVVSALVCYQFIGLVRAEGFKENATHTAYTTDGNTVRASVVFNDWMGWHAWHAFDDAANFSGWSSDDSIPEWIEYEFANARIIDNYDMTAWEATWYPQDWTVSGSNDRISWTTIDTVTGETGWAKAETRNYVIDVRDLYRNYRFTFTKCQNSDRAFCEIDSIKLYSFQSTVTPTPVQGIMCPPTEPSDGQATIDVALSDTGNYRLWAEAKGTESGGYLYAKIDALGCVNVADVAADSSFVWRSDGATPLLSSGSHTVTLYGSNVAVDRILLTKDISCTPTGNGDVCLGIISTPTVAQPLPSPTPTLRQKRNQSSDGPTIVSDRLPAGKPQVQYSAQMVATDPTANDILGMTVIGLPDGLQLMNCVMLHTTLTTLTCDIIGVPKVRSRSYPVFRVIDRDGNTVSKSFSLRVW